MADIVAGGAQFDVNAGGGRQHVAVELELVYVLQLDTTEQVVD